MDGRDRAQHGAGLSHPAGQAAGSVDSAAEPRRYAAPLPEQRELNAFLRREIGQLNETYREVLLLHYFSGMTAREIADVLTISRSAVLKRLERGRQILGEHLVDALGQGFTPRKSKLPERVTRIMGLVAVAEIAWTPSTAAASTLGVHGAIETLRTGSAVLKGALIGGASLVVVSVALVVGSGMLTASPPDVRDTAESIQELPTEEAVVVLAAQASVPPAEADVKLARNAPVSSPAAIDPAALLASIPVPSGAPRNATPLGYPGACTEKDLRHDVRGVVYSPGGDPLPEAKVWIARTGFGPRDTRETVSDEGGRFRFRVPDGQWTLRAAKGILGGEADTSPRGEFIVEGEDQTVSASIRTRERSLLRGQLFDKVSGRPVAGGRVWTDARQLIEADGEGCFTIEGVPRHDHTLVVLCPGYERERVLYSTALREEAELDLFLKPGGLVTGVVTDEKDRPVAYAWVWLHGTQYAEVCDEQGRFVCDGVPVARKVRFGAQWPCYASVCWAPDPGETMGSCRVADRARPQPLALTLPEGPIEETRICVDEPFPERRAVIRGRVLDPKGEPVRNFLIRLGLTRPSSGGDRVWIEYSIPGVAFASDDGSFALSDEHDRQPGQEVRVVASAEGYRDAVLERVPFGEAATSRPVDEVVLRLGEPKALEVRVQADGAVLQPAQGARVTLVDPFWDVVAEGFKLDRVHDRGNRPRTVRADDAGCARFPDVPFADGLIMVEHEGFATTAEAWDGQASSVTVMLEHSGVVEGTVSARNGGALNPVTDDFGNKYAMVILQGSLDGTFDQTDPNDVSREYCIRIDDGDSFYFEDLPPRHYDLCVSWNADDDSRSFQGYSDSFTLEPGQTLSRSYPRDELTRDPDRFLAWGEQFGDSSDAALREKLLGTWAWNYTLADGVKRHVVGHYGEDGSWWKSIFLSERARSPRSNGRYWPRIPAHTVTFTGWFSVYGGGIDRLNSIGKRGANPSFAVNGDELVFPPPPLPPSAQGPTCRIMRARDTEAALQKAETACGVKRDTDLPIVITSGGSGKVRSSGGGFGQ